jgi:hypothetical protein
MVILMASTYLTDPAKGDYNTYIGKHGEFTTWDEMKNWLLETYRPIGATIIYRNFYLYELQQETGEVPDAYYRRFLDALSLMDRPIDEQLIRHHFTMRSLPHYRTLLMADTEYANTEKSLDDIVAKMKRLPLPPREGSSGGRSFALAGWSSNGQDLSGRSSSNALASHVNKKRKYDSNSNNSGNNNDRHSNYDKRPLTDGERRFLDQNIAKGGGIIVSDAVQNKSAWLKEARERNLCIKCAGTGHCKPNCTATKRSNENGGTSSLNAILPGANPLNFLSQL